MFVSLWETYRHTFGPLAPMSAPGTKGLGPWLDNSEHILSNNTRVFWGWWTALVKLLTHSPLLSQDRRNGERFSVGQNFWCWKLIQPLKKHVWRISQIMNNNICVPWWEDRLLSFILLRSQTIWMLTRGSWKGLGWWGVMMGVKTHHMAAGTAIKWDFTLILKRQCRLHLK